MKILHLLYESKGDAFGVGGVATRAYEIYGRLKDRHDVTFLCKKYPSAREGRIEGIRHIFAGVESKSLTVALLSYARHASQFVRERGNEYDIIIEEFSPGIPTFLPAFTKKPLILQLQDYTGKLYFRKYSPLYALPLCLLEMLRPRFYDNFIFVNSEMINRFPIKGSSHIATIPNGISPGMLNGTPVEDNYILYLGRIDIYKKGLDILLEAYSEFIKSFPELRLVIAGDGRDREKLNCMIKSLPDNIRKSIETLGWVSGEKKRDILNGTLFAIFPSRHEAQPIALLEAMGSGKAVIVSEIPELDFAIKSGAAVSFKPQDAMSLARAMRSLASDNERATMGFKGRNWAKDFTWDKIALRYEEFLYKVLQG